MQTIQTLEGGATVAASEEQQPYCCGTQEYAFSDQRYICSLALVMDLIGGKWKPLVLFHLAAGPQRSGDLQRRMRGITNKMFTQSVRELELAGLLQRKVYPVVPPHVEYSLTELGHSLVPAIKQLDVWGKQFAV